MLKNGKPNITLPITELENYEFSFSGIKTAVINLHHKNPNLNKADLCASFENTITKMLINNCSNAIKNLKLNKLVLAGGVSKNSYIRKEFDELSKKLKIDIFYPEGLLCTDNAAMIAASGYYDFLKGNFADLKLNAVPNLKL